MEAAYFSLFSGKKDVLVSIQEYASSCDGKMSELFAACATEAADSLYAVLSWETEFYPARIQKHVFIDRSSHS